MATAHDPRPLAHDPRPLVMFCGGGSGGHLTPGLAVAEALLRTHDPPDVLFLTGRRPAELRMMRESPHPHRSFPLAPARRTLASPAFARGFAAAANFARRAARGRPCVALGTGGYASVPGVVGAKLGGAGVLLLEPNGVPGRANRRLAPLAVRTLHETPVGPGPAAVTVGPRSLLILGGSLGAASLDRAVPAALAPLAERLGGWTVAHQCGTDPAAVRAPYERIGVRAEVARFFPDAAARLAACGVGVTRGGAVTLAEAAAYEVPLVVVPHPRVPDRHQHANAARHLASHGGATVEDDADLVDGLRTALAAAIAAARPPTRTRDDAVAGAAGRVAAVVLDELARRRAG